MGEGKLVDLYQEVYNRINTAMGSGKSLNGVVKTFKQGERSISLTENDCTAVILNFGDFETGPQITPGNRSGSLAFTNRIEIDVFHGIDDSYAENTLWDLSENTGSLYTIQKILDVLMTDISGNVKPRPIDGMRSTPTYRVSRMGILSGLLVNQITIDIADVSYDVGDIQEV